MSLPKKRILSLSLLCTLGMAGALISCKSKSSGGSAGSPTDNTADLQKQLNSPNATQNSSMMITLGGKSVGQTVDVSNANLETVGSLTVSVSGITAANLVVGLITAPQGVNLVNQNGNYRLGGQLTSGPTPVDIVILARDRSKCTAADCSVAVNSSTGRFESQVTPNTVSDVQGQFKIQVSSTASPFGNVNPGGGTGLGNGRLANLGTGIMDTLKSGYQNAVGYIQGLFE